MAWRIVDAGYAEVLAAETPAEHENAVRTAGGGFPERAIVPS
ncbi:hypothetical protein [Streptomyces lacrimifluminis]|nr:hypothetical protein [Streptomyces lacrimifluminis]